MDNTESLSCIKKIAQYVIGKHASGEVRYFNIIWKRFLKDDSLNMAPSKTSILTFAENQNIGLFSPSVLFVLKGVMAELNRKIDRPTYDKVKDAVHSCAVALGASKDIAAAVENDISNMVYENLINMADSLDSIGTPKFPSQRSIVINSTGDIIIDGKIVKLQRYPNILLREYIRKKSLHWGIGFILFPKWTDGKLKDPRYQFRNLGSKISMFMQEHGLDIKICWEKDDGGETGYVSLKIPERINISGSVVDALKLTQNAESMLKQKQYKDVLKCTIKAFQKDGGQIRPMLLFSETLKYLDSNQLSTYKERTNKIRNKLKVFYEIRKGLLRVPHNFKEYIKRYSSWDNFIYQCAEEMNNIAKAINILDETLKGRRFEQSPKIQEFNMLCDLLSKMREVDIDTEEYRCLYYRLVATETVKEVFDNTEKSFYYLSADRKEDLKSSLNGSFWQFLSTTNRHPHDYENIEHLKGSWVEALKFSMRDCV